MSLAVELADDAATRRLGARLAGLVGEGDLIALHGGLGAGKTTLARGLVSALMGTETEVVSPTFTLVQVYETPTVTVWHFDLYRLEAPEDLAELGWQEAEHGVALVEWPGHAGRHLPAWRLDLTLEHDGNGRIAHLEPHGEDWQKRLHGFQFRSS